ncbi:MAG: threonine-phosphate decarboxylase [Clostridia bacterium]|nr:threonine-phosphate decarboxylase [Clostridia bacterium]
MKQLENSYGTVKHGGDWQGAIDKYGWQPDEIIDFSANINPLGPPDSVIKTLKENLKFIERYPDPLCRELKKKLSHYLGVDLKTIIAGNGAIELIYLLCQVYKPKRVLILEPTFMEYRRAAEIAGAEVVTFNLNPDDFSLDIDKWRENIEKIDMTFICNPNNPTGRLLKPEILYEIVETCQKNNIFLVVDESFLDFIPNWPTLSLVKQAANSKRLFILRSLTKFFALPGLRLGCGVGCPELIKKLEAHCYPWSINILAQKAGITALSDLNYMKKSRELIFEEKKYLYNGLLNLKFLKPYYPEVNFILSKIITNRFKVFHLAKALIKGKILIRDCSSFSGLGPDYFRIAVRNREDNNKLLKVLKTVVEER